MYRVIQGMTPVKAPRAWMSKRHPFFAVDAPPEKCPLVFCCHARLGTARLARKAAPLEEVPTVFRLEKS